MREPIKDSSDTDGGMKIEIFQNRSVVFSGTLKDWFSGFSSRLSMLLIFCSSPIFFWVCTDCPDAVTPFALRNFF
jgi:hypothetical protein